MERGNEMAYEYYLSFWGAAETVIEEKLGITERNFWFDTLEEREVFIDKLRTCAKGSRLALNREEGEHVRTKTISKIWLGYQGKEYYFEYDCGYAYPIDAAYYMFQEGNYSCDCNLSSFLQRAYPDSGIEEMDCGEEIKLLSINVVLV